MRTLLRLSVLFLSLFLFPLLAPSAAAVVIDAFVDEYPPNPDLPASGWTTIFVGSTCDAGPFGGSCPPGTIVNHPTSDQAVQSGLAGVLGGHRTAVITRVGTTGSSSSDIFSGVMCHSHGPSARTVLEFSYGLPADLNANLTVGAATGIEVYLLDGDLNDSVPQRPVPVTVTVTSGRGTPSAITRSVTQSIVMDATTYLFAFASFPGVDFTDVDRIVFRLDASAVSAVDYCIGPFKTDETPVPLETRSWGSIKSLHR